MKDRVPLYPGRVKLVPVSGQENTYDMTRADQPTQAGDPLNKATLWSDVTAALFGLGVDSVPDDGFAYLGKYAQHWWRRRSKGGHYRVKISEKDTSNNRYYYISRFHSKSTGGGYSKEISVPYSDNVSIDISGKITGLAEPIKYLTYTYDGYTSLNKIKGKFIQQTEKTEKTGDITYGDFFYIPESGKPKKDVDSEERQYTVWFTKTGVLTTEYLTEVGPWEYVRSSDRLAYPDYGLQDGYEYEYLGIPFDNAVGAPKVEVGSYVGTGTYGASNPNSLTFGFVPLLVIIIDPYSYYVTFTLVKDCEQASVSNARSSGGQTTVSWTFNSVEWYGQSSINQLNNNGYIYRYFAIG